MGRGTCTGKRRILGEGTGAEDGNGWSEIMRSGAVIRVGVEYTKPPGHGGSKGGGLERGCTSWATVRTTT